MDKNIKDKLLPIAVVAALVCGGGYWVFGSSEKELTAEEKMALILSQSKSKEKTTSQNAPQFVETSEPMQPVVQEEKPVVEAPEAPQSTTVETSSGVALVQDGSGSDLPIYKPQEANVPKRTFQIAGEELTEDEVGKRLKDAIYKKNVEAFNALIAAGAPVSFTNNDVCSIAGIPARVSINRDSSEVDKLVSLLGMNDENYFLPTNCNNNYIKEFSIILNKTRSKEDFFFYNATWHEATRKDKIDADKIIMDEEAKLGQMYEVYASKLNTVDYNQLMFVFLNKNIPTKYRIDAVKKWTENYETFAGKYSETVAKNLDAVKPSLNSSSSTEKQKKAYRKLFTPIDYAVVNQFQNFVSVSNALTKVNNTNAIKINQYQRTKPELKNFNFYDIDVNAFIDGSIRYDVKGDTASNEFGENPYIFEIGSNFKKYIINQMNFKYEHEVNTELSILHSLLNSQAFDINKQDNEGNSILHHVAKLKDESKDKRSTAIIVRALILMGANVDAKNNAGVTARDLLLELHSGSKVVEAINNGEFVGAFNKTEYLPNK